MKALKTLLCATFALSAAAVAMPPTMVSAHEGSLDSLGCHYGRNHRDYHCHEGIFAGQSFLSRGFLMRNWNRLKGEAIKKQHEGGQNKDDDGGEGR
jgi:hypothetical protein